MPIFDQGYQHWSGTLSGHAWRWLAITRHGVRVGMNEPLAAHRACSSPGCRRSSWRRCCACGGCSSRSPTSSQPLVPLLGASSVQQIAGRPEAYRVEVWTLCYSYFLRDRAAVLDDR